MGRRNRNLLMIAVMYGNVEMSQFIISLGCCNIETVDTLDHNGKL